MVIDRKIWDEFKKKVKDKGLSASFVVRKLIEMYNSGRIDISVDVSVTKGGSITIKALDES